MVFFFDIRSVSVLNVLKRNEIANCKDFSIFSGIRYISFFEVLKNNKHLHDTIYFMQTYRTKILVF